MTRLFRVLALLTTLALTATYLCGVLVHWGVPALFLWHFNLGLFTALGTLLVHCLIFTYFLGTGRWVKEVAQAYRLPDYPWPRRTRDLKRSTFPPALLAMLSTIATAAAGQGAFLADWPWGIHFTLATLTLILNLAVFRRELRHLAENARILDAVMIEVERRRAAQEEVLAGRRESP